MLDPDNHIARLELRAEQMAIHLRSWDETHRTPQARDPRSTRYCSSSQC
jgi:hypothetical protein